MKVTRYKQIQEALKKQIQHGVYNVGDYLPSENELCATYSITRTTARKALEELQKEGFIIRKHGKGSEVRERRESLGLLTVKGFSEAVSHNIKTMFLETPHIIDWNEDFPFKATPEEKAGKWIHFSRLRFVNNQPIVVENNWLTVNNIPDFCSEQFIEGSFFKTLSQKYLIEIVGSEQEIRALSADKVTARLLNMEESSPILMISIKYFTNISDY